MDPGGRTARREPGADDPLGGPFRVGPGVSNTRIPLARAWSIIANETVWSISRPNVTQPNPSGVIRRRSGMASFESAGMESDQAMAGISGDGRDLARSRELALALDIARHESRRA